VPEATVVIPTRDRAQSLQACLAALGGQRTARAFEVVVVDDGSRPPLGLASDAAVLVVRTDGIGPARARNRGIAEAGGDLVLFTDDDTVPDAGWVEAACAFLASRPDYVGVEGPVWSEPWDPLYAHSLANAEPGAYWTCNVAYRRAALEAVGGFSEVFPYPHCEDLDLGFRLLGLGPIGWAPAMRVEHRVRPVGFEPLVRRALLLESEIVLFRRHRARFGPRAGRLPARAYPTVHLARSWAGRVRGDGLAALARRPRRTLRLAGVAAGQLALSCYVAARAR
jgi:GT2 family glycosyltransferase